MNNSQPSEKTNEAQDSLSSTSHYDLIRKMQPFACDETLKSWTLIAGTLALLILAFTVASLNLALGWRIVGSVFAALLMVRVFTIYHDYLHGAILRNSKTAKVFMSFIGLLFLRPPADWQRSHNYHHQHNSQLGDEAIGSFPIMTVREWKETTSMKRAVYRVARSPWVVVFGYFFCFLLETLKKVSYKDDAIRRQSQLALGLHVLIGVFCWRAGVDVFLLSFLIPYLISCCVGSYLFYVQHAFDEMKFLSATDWNYSRAALESSSCLQAGPLTHWFTGNIGFHHIHHLNPKIPFYKLPQVMKAIPQLQNPAFVKLNPYSIYQSFQLKLWDEDKTRMVNWV